MRSGRVGVWESGRVGGLERDTDVSSPPLRVSLSPALILAAVAMLALPIFAHGCHRGDHDDEPLYAPVEQRASPVELPK